MKKVTIPIRFGKIKGLCWGKGNTKKVLALHGWLDNAASFTQLAPLLAKDGYEVIAIDFSGHGKSDHRAKGHFVHFGDFVIDVHDVINQLKWDKCILLGHSMGAAMAMMYSAAFPEKIEKQILIENLGPVPAYKKGTAAKNLRESLEQWSALSIKHSHYYSTTEQALKVRKKATPMADDILRPLVKRGIKKTKKGYRFRTDKRLRMGSLIRFNEDVVQDIVSSKKPPTQVILAKPTTYAMSYSSAKKRLETLNPQNMVELNGHHHLHMDKAREVYQAINKFLK